MVGRQPFEPVLLPRKEPGWQDAGFILGFAYHSNSFREPVPAMVILLWPS